MLIVPVTPMYAFATRFTNSNDNWSVIHDTIRHVSESIESQAHVNMMIRLFRAFLTDRTQDREFIIVRITGTGIRRVNAPMMLGPPQVADYQPQPDHPYSEYVGRIVRVIPETVPEHQRLDDRDYRIVTLGDHPHDSLRRYTMLGVPISRTDGFVVLPANGEAQYEYMWLTHDQVTVIK